MNHPALQGLSYNDLEPRTTSLESLRYGGKSLPPVKEAPRKVLKKTEGKSIPKRVLPVSDKAISEARIMKLISEEVSRIELPKVELPDFQNIIRQIVSEEISKIPAKEPGKISIESVEGVDRLIRNLKQGIDQRWGAHGGKTSLEVPSGLINSVNKVYTLSKLPHSNTDFILFKNGMKQSVQNGDYTISGSTITMTLAPITNQDFLEVQWLK